ncbi:MAG: group II truncated hemoglobin [Hyphomicrobiaceae bacterium]
MAMNSLYAQLGGEHVVRELVEVFYDIVESEPEGHALKILHLRGHGIAHSRIEQFNFLTGFFGGPKLYAEKHGHSNVRKMHEHVEINSEARDAWLNCMTMALDRVKVGTPVKEEIMRHFRVVAHNLQNQE